MILTIKFEDGMHYLYVTLAKIHRAVIVYTRYVITFSEFSSRSIQMEISAAARKC